MQVREEVKWRISLARHRVPLALIISPHGRRHVFGGHSAAILVTPQVTKCLKCERADRQRANGIQGADVDVKSNVGDVVEGLVGGEGPRA
jgi:hypothetical protein